MNEIVKSAVMYIASALISFGLVCLAVLFFAIQFGFDWSFLLCVCVWMALFAARWIMQGAKND